MRVYTVQHGLFQLIKLIVLRRDKPDWRILRSDLWTLYFLLLDICFWYAYNLLMKVKWLRQCYQSRWRQTVVKWGSVCEWSPSLAFHPRSPGQLEKYEPFLSTRFCRKHPDFKHPSPFLNKHYWLVILSTRCSVLTDLTYGVEHIKTSRVVEKQSLTGTCFAKNIDISIIM